MLTLGLLLFYISDYFVLTCGLSLILNLLYSVVLNVCLMRYKFTDSGCFVGCGLGFVLGGFWVLFCLQVSVGWSPGEFWVVVDVVFPFYFDCDVYMLLLGF